MQEYIDRTEGRPMKSEGQAGQRGAGAVFVLTMPDGTRVPAPSAPRQLVGTGSRPAAERPAGAHFSAVDALILGLEQGNGAGKT